MKTETAADFKNWLPTSNPFNLVEPPAYFLKALLAYDDKIVLFPSTHEPYYRLTRRGPIMPLWKTLARKYPDLAICIEHGLIPDTSIYPAALCDGDPWSDVIPALARRDMSKLDDTPFKSAADRYSEQQDALDRGYKANREKENANRLDGLVDDFHMHVQHGFGERLALNEPEHIVGRGRQAPFDFARGGSSVILSGDHNTQRPSVTGKPTGIVLTDL